MERKRKKEKLIDMNQFSSKQKVLLAICFLLIVIGALMVSKLIFKKREIDYTKMNATKFIEQGELNNDREIYWSLNEIISNIISSYKNIDEKDSITPDKFYHVLTDEYREYLGKNKFNKRMDSFLQKFIIENPYSNSIKTTRVVSEVYSLSNNKYMCKLSPSKDGVEAYIGIILNTLDKTYGIFYIE
ncbi:MAG: hypothetical protein PHP54_02005 [Clostridia bacterium]|nr:hypothetical protein [Clostridia bacterium]